MGDFKKWGDPNNWGDDFEMGRGGGGLISFYELCFHNAPDTVKSKTDKKESLKSVEEAVPQKWLRSGS